MKGGNSMKKVGNRCPIRYCGEQGRFSVVKIALGSWTPEVRLYNFYLSLVKTNVFVIVINYITM